MAVDSTSSSTLSSISSSYVSTTAEDTEDSEYLGKEDFLALLVAQLQNQDPLDPSEGTDFATELAEYSQLEQLMNLNENIETLVTTLSSTTDGDATDYLGKTVTGNVNTMDVSDGEVTSGFYNLAQAAEVIVDIYDADGSTVTRLYLGQEEAGGQLIAWDGTDSDGNAVEDGTYTYTVLADYGSGFEEVETSVTGTVDGVVENNGKTYLVVQGVLVALENLTAVTESNTTDSESLLDYLGLEVTTNAPIILVEDGAVYGEELSFTLDTVEDVTVRIYDPYDELVETITISADDLSTGKNSVYWDAVAENGYAVSDGLYYYTVMTDSGEYADTIESGTAGAILNVNSSQYLKLDETGRLVALTAITKVQEIEGDEGTQNDDTASDSE